MAISYISNASAEATTLTMPTHVAGDLLLMAAYRHNSATAPTLPSGWLLVSTGGGGTNSLLVAGKIASSASETSGTWTNATHLACAVYREATLLHIGTTALAGGVSSASINYPAISPDRSFGDTWYVGIGGHRANDSDINLAPTGMTNRLNLIGATNGELVIHDTNGAVSSWASTNVTNTVSTTTGYRTAVCEIVDLGVAMSAGTASGSLINSQQLVRQGWM